MFDKKEPFKHSNIYYIYLVGVTKWFLFTRDDFRFVGLAYCELREAIDRTHK